ncbi:MAG: Crp/Fnr family transcriptional regulator [Hyphomicrobiaceae bacterium]|nr:Crp/Fnr family transcriptional regulator [Hyphomicrobiaceae bacterium]MCC0024010.1 Crp/Fnr family transcriptional regulator [Hyphomicrobiaceae bacterium]
MTESPNWILTATGLTSLEPAAQKELAGLNPVVVPKGHVLFRPGDRPQGFVLVLSGRIDVHLVGPAGRDLLLYSVQPGETCVQTTLGILGEQDYSGEAVTETDVSAVIVPRERFFGLMEHSPKFRQFVFHAFAQRMQGVTSLLEQVAFVRIETRLAAAILDLMDENGVVSETHQALATRIGTSREVVSRRLDAFKQRGIVDLNRGEVSVTDRAALVSMAGI